MEKETLLAAATLAAASLHSRTQEGNKVGRAHMTAALLTAMEAIQEAQREWEKHHPKPA